MKLIIARIAVSICFITFAIGMELEDVYTSTSVILPSADDAWWQQTIRPLLIAFGFSIQRDTSSLSSCDCEAAQWRAYQQALVNNPNLTIGGEYQLACNYAMADAFDGPYDMQFFLFFNKRSGSHDFWVKYYISLAREHRAAIDSLLLKQGINPSTYSCYHLFAYSGVLSLLQEKILLTCINTQGNSDQTVLLHELNHIFKFIEGKQETREEYVKKIFPDLLILSYPVPSAQTTSCIIM